MASVLNPPIYLIVRLVAALEWVFLHLTQPSRHSITLATVADLARSQADLITENALLRSSKLQAVSWTITSP